MKLWHPDTCECVIALKDGEPESIVAPCKRHVDRDAKFVADQNRHKNAVVEEVRKVFRAETDAEKAAFYAAPLWSMAGEDVELTIPSEKAREVSDALATARLNARVKNG